MSRVISGLKWARVADRPGFARRSRAKGSKYQGLKYERQLSLAIPAATWGQWFQFEDANGPGWCQTDLIFGAYGRTVCLEAKYTWTAAGHHQINKLYRPVLEAVYGRAVAGVVVCKTLTGETPRFWVSSDLESAVCRAASGEYSVLHWLGTSLVPLQARQKSLPLATSRVQL